METYWLEHAEADVPPGVDWLSPREAACLTGMRFPKRRTDWILGRWTAKRALAAYLKLPADSPSLSNIEVLATPSGAPEAFLGRARVPATISISHRAGNAVCAISPDGAALGCDIELIEPHGDNFVADYLTTSEQERVACVSVSDQPQLVTLFWSAKESALKALRQGLRLDTRSLDVRLDPQASGAEAARWCPLQVHYHGGDTLPGWWQCKGLLVRTLVALPAPLAPVPLL